MMNYLFFASGTHHHVSGTITALFTVLLVGMIVTLALEEKIHAKKSIIVGVFAFVSLFLATVFGILPYVWLKKMNLHMPIYIPAVDWGVISIILGSSLFVDVTSNSGLFTWIAIKLTKASKGDPLKLLIYYSVMTVLFSAVLNNVTAMIIVGALTGVSLNKLEQRDKLLGFLLIEGLLTNIGGLLTLISSVPNIIVGKAAGISFLKFFLISSPYVVIATIVTIYVGAKFFKITPLKDEKEQKKAAELIESFDENNDIKSQSFFWFGVVMTILFILTIASTSVLPYLKDLGMGFVAMAFALIMLLRFKSEANKFYQEIDWDLIGFFIALFIVINVMEHAQVLALIGSGIEVMLKLGKTLGTTALLLSSSAFSSVTDNIPLSAMLAKILSHRTGTTQQMWWSVIFGANLGGNITPIGSASTLVAVTIIHNNKLTLSFADFVKKALPFALIQITLATIYVLIFL